MRSSPPRFLMGMRAWRELSAELERVAPAEGLAIPLMALELRHGLAHPAQTLHLEHIKRVLIPRLFFLPARLQANHAARVQALAGSDAHLQTRIDHCLDLYPRLRPAGFIHSNPFASLHTWPSSGARGDIEGHLLPLRARNLEAGLATSFSLIACRKGKGSGWRLQAFALDRHKRVRDCGLVRPAPDSHPALRRALRGNALQRQAGRDRLGPWLADMEHAGFLIEMRTLFDGWLRCDLNRGSLRCRSILLPPDFPRQAPLSYALGSMGWRAEGPVLPRLEGCKEVA